MIAKIFVIITICSLFVIIPSSYAQLSLGDEANQISIEVTISSTDEVTVKHIVLQNNSPVSVNFMKGTVSNWSVTNYNGEEKQFGVFGANEGVMIFPTEQRSIVKYNLENAVVLKDGIKSVDINYDQIITIIPPKDINLLYIDNSVVSLGDKKGISCHGCVTTISYYENEASDLQKVNWEDREFLVEIFSNLETDNFVFEQQSKSISFQVDEKNRFVSILLPLELLWEPYHVFLDDEKMLYQNLPISETHVLINMAPETSGTISIIGTTVIPEFPIIAPLAIGFLMILALPFIKKFNLH